MSTTSTSSTSPSRHSQDDNSLKRSHLTQSSLESTDNLVEDHPAQSPSPTKKRRVFPEVQPEDNFGMDSSHDIVKAISSSAGLEQFPTLKIGDSTAEEFHNFQARSHNAMVTFGEVSSSVRLESPSDHIEMAKTTVEVGVHEEHTASEDDDQMVVVSLPTGPMTLDGNLLPYTGPEKYKPLKNAHDFRSMTLLQFTDCPNLIALVAQRGQNHGNGTITPAAKLMFDDLWTMAWEIEMDTLIEMDSMPDSDFRKLIHLIMVEYQTAESRRLMTRRTLGYIH